MASSEHLQIWQRNSLWHAAGTPPLFSVIILGHQRALGLKNAIQSLFPFANESIELLVVVNGNNRQVENIIETISPPFPFAYRKISECRPGEARNHALDFARGEIIVFLDDDIVCFQNIFQKAKELFKNPNLAAIGGPNLTPPQSGFWARASGYAYSSWAVTGPTRGRYFLNRLKIPATEHDLILCNLFVRKHFVKRLGFPKNFVSNEENYLLQSLQTEGALLAADPELAVFHDRRPDIFGLVQQGMKYGTGRAQNILANPASFSWKYFLPICVLINTILAILFPILWIGFGIYLLAVWITVSEKNKQGLDLAFFAAPLAALIIHLAYAVGLMRGFTAWGWRKSGLQETF